MHEKEKANTPSLQAGDIGGFLFTFYHHWLYGRDCSNSHPPTTEGHIWHETFFNQNQRDGGSEEHHRQ